LVTATRAREMACRTALRTFFFQDLGSERLGAASGVVMAAPLKDSWQRGLGV
jgi:hypothetical protein